MAINIPGFSSPAVGLDDPLGLLSACHERMGRQCATLQRLAAYLARHGAGETVADARGEAAKSEGAGVDTSAADTSAVDTSAIDPSANDTAAVDVVAQTAATSVLRYFDTAALQHHRDEEEDLFPALIESMAGSDARCLHAMADGLAQEHRQLEAQWSRLRVPLAALSAGRPATLDEAAVQRFCAQYADHIQREEDELLPLAARLLDDQALSDMGQAMRARRGGDAS